MEFPKAQFKRPKFERAAWREWLIVLTPAVLLVVAAFSFTARFIQPAPPTTIVFSAGAEGGAGRYVRMYQEILKRDGITLDVRRSAGALENLARLRGDNPVANAGFVQGGTTLPEDSNHILSLGRMFYEPLWVFHRLPASTDRLTQLKGKRIAVGRDGGGTQILALHLLRVSDVNASNSTLLEISGKEALSALQSGKVDAAFFLAPPDANFLLPLLRSPHIRLMPFAQAEAYVKHYPYLSHITLNRGVINFTDNIPSQPVPMVAAAALLAVRDDLHPALQFLLIQAAAEVHKRSTLIHEANQFPQAQSTELPMSQVADRFLKSGPPFLQRYLPFWLAVLVERLLVLLIPVITVLIPLIKILPMIYTWRIRKRLWRWYEALKRLEHDIALDPDNLEKHRAEMARIDKAVSGIPVPVQYSEPYYNLRAHIEYVQRRLENHATAAPAPAPAPA